MTTTRQKALRILTETQGPVSGEAMGEALGVSRAAVWKHVQHLREAGFRIDSAPRRGYSLRPSALDLSARAIGSLLNTDVVGRDLKVLAEVGSTNSVAKAEAERGCAEGLVILADHQTGGRGRLFRTWFSPAGTGLYLSVVLRPTVVPHRIPELAIAATLAVVRTLGDVTPDLDPQVKWPNDVYLGGRKACGILCDVDAELDRVRYLVLGIGLNANVADGEFPADIAVRATSLLIEGGRRIDRSLLAATLLTHVERIYREWLATGLSGMMEEWLSYSLLTKRDVVVDTPAGPVAGRVSGLAPSGALLIRDQAGAVREIVSGDVHVASF